MLIKRNTKTPREKDRTQRRRLKDRLINDEDKKRKGQKEAEREKDRLEEDQNIKRKKKKETEDVGVSEKA